jgi:hypothetical protein
MKITKQDYAELKNAIESSPIFPRLMEYREKGLSDKRYRWDCLWSINREFRSGWFDRVYQYADDTHVDTALRKITNTK